jgi:hypothetical protein
VANNIAGILARLVKGLHLFSVFTYIDLLAELLLLLAISPHYENVPL